MELKSASILGWCLLLLVGTIVRAEERNGVEEGTGQENKNNVATYAIECSDDSRIPEHVVNCELLIAGLKSDSGVNRQELCCTLLSSQATKSMCCHQIRDLCDSYNGSQCPKSRRRIKPPRPISDREGKTKKSIDHKTTERPPTSVLFYKAKKVTPAV